MASEKLVPSKYFTNHTEEERRTILHARKQQLLQQAEQLTVVKKSELTKAKSLLIPSKQLDDVINKINEV